MKSKLFIFQFILLVLFTAASSSKKHDITELYSNGFFGKNSSIQFQDNIKVKNPEHLLRVLNENPEADFDFIWHGDTIVDIHPVYHNPFDIENPNERKSYIIRFKGEPLRLKKQGEKLSSETIMAAKSRLQEQRKRFSADLAQIEYDTKKPGALANTAVSEIEHEYFTALNGLALKTTKRIADEIEKLPYVEKVSEDVRVRLVDNESNEIVNADHVWNSLGYTGSGILISIIDTGIDYDHRELAGKVAGGYDFVNEDDDAWDDHGHGTHCAGIAAANGPELKGVAPDADLLAVKVLNAGGSGSSSDIIAGIEYSVAQGADVISMSLGGPGDPNDDMSAAVDNAVKNGVICVVAAGNSGPGSFSIGSPGCARLALTVGASDKADNIAYFSSRGPSNAVNGLKPDLLAPGVAIYSSTPNDNYASWNGTSMATPHAAGAAALLRQINPGWDPLVIKASLMNKSVDLGYNVWEQGTGRMDVYASAVTKSAAKPASLNFGIDDLTLDVWTEKDTFWIHNFRASAQTFDISLDASFPAGIDVSVVPSNALVPGSDSVMIVVELEVDNRIVPFPDSDPPAYSGYLVSTGSLDTLKTIFAFIKSHVLNLTFDENPSYLFIHNNGSKYMSTYWPGTSFSAMLPEDDYDIVVRYSDQRTYIIKEGVYVYGQTSLDILKSEAGNNVTFNAYDENGNPKWYYRGVTSIFNKNSMWGTTSSGYSYQNLNLNDISSNYRYETVGKYMNERTSDPNCWLFPFGLNQGISSDTVISNDYTKVKKITYKLPEPETGDELFFIPYISQGIGFSFANYTTDSGSSYRLSSEPYEFCIRYAPYPYEDFIYKYTYLQIHNTTGGLNPGWPNQIFQTALQNIFPEDTLKANIWDFENPVWITTENNTACSIGDFAPVFTGRFQNIGSSIRLASDPYYAFRYFTDQYGSVFNNTSCTYTITNDESSIVDAGTIDNRDFDVNFDVFSLPNDEYSMEIEFNDFSVNGSAAAAKVTAAFNTNLADCNPPFFKNFKITSYNEIAGLFENGSNNYINFQARDDKDEVSAALKIKKENDGVWSSISLSQNGEFFSGQLPDNLSPGFYFVRLELYDEGNNYLQYDLEPAFKINISAPQLVSPADNTTDYSMTGRLVWSDLDADSYTVQVSESPEFSSFVINTGVSSNTFNLSGLEKLTTYYWRVNAVFGSETSSWSETRSFTTEDNPCLETNSPAYSEIIIGERRICKAINLVRIPETGGDFIVRGNGSTGGSAQITSGGSIVFKPGFKVERGGSLRAYISGNPCEQILERTPAPDNNAEIADNNHFSIYPNPSNGSFTLETNVPEELQSLEIINILGEKVYSLQELNKINMINISDKAKGIYIVKLKSGKNIFSRKIVLN